MTLATEQALLDRVAIRLGPSWMSPDERIAWARRQREAAARDEARLLEDDAAVARDVESKREADRADEAKALSNINGGLT